MRTIRKVANTIMAAQDSDQQIKICAHSCDSIDPPSFPQYTYRPGSRIQWHEKLLRSSFRPTTHVTFSWSAGTCVKEGKRQKRLCRYIYTGCSWKPLTKTGDGQKMLYSPYNSRRGFQAWPPLDHCYSLGVVFPHCWCLLFPPPPKEPITKPTLHGELHVV